MKLKREKLSECEYLTGRLNGQRQTIKIWPISNHWGGTVSGGRMNKRKRNLANELAKGIKEMRKHDAGKLTLRTGKMRTGNIRTKRPGQGLAVTG